MQLLTDEAAGLHAFVIGEIAAGNLPNRRRVLADLMELPQGAIADEAEVHRLLETHRLWGLGLGWIDLHLLASAMLSGWNLLTGDHAMMAAAKKLGVAYPAN